MITKDHILSIANEHLKGTDLFVTGVRISSDNHINLFIDGDKGVTIKDCVELSRVVESQLDRNRDDYSLDVSSYGATTPLMLPRQYKKHIGRELELQLIDKTKTEGALVDCNEEEIKIEYSVRENKPIGKGKITVVKQQVIKYNQIRESKIKLKY